MSRTFLVHPFERALLGGKLFDSPYGVLRDLFARAGIELATSDRHDLASAEKVLLFNYDRAFHDRCLVAGLQPEQLVLFTFEPPVVMPAHGDAALWARFGCVFVHDDRLVDGVRRFKLRYPQAQAPMTHLPAFEDRRFLTLINANKYSSEPGELYSARRRAIRWFEAHEPGFDLYGYGWADGGPRLTRHAVRGTRRARRLWKLLRYARTGRRPYASYRGSVEDKRETLCRYRFSICFENQGNLPGYVTEKVFDCLVCGTIPIYLGAPNITDHVPADCFIDMRRFGSFAKLSQHLHELDAAEVEALRSSGAAFIRSSAFDAWRPEGVFGAIVDALR